MIELVKLIAMELVDDPEQVVVHEVKGFRTSVFELSVARSDLGKIIGKQGRTAQALRIILKAASTKMKKRASLEIIE